jgi:hypothetical protein
VAQQLFPSRDLLKVLENTDRFKMSFPKFDKNGKKLADQGNHERLCIHLGQMAAHEASFTMYNPFKDGSIILELTNQLYHDVFDSPEHPLIVKVLYSKKRIFHANIYFRSKVSSRKQKDLHHDIVANIAFYIGQYHSIPCCESENI